MRFLLSAVLICCATAVSAGEWPLLKDYGSFKPCIRTLAKAPDSPAGGVCITQASEAASFNQAPYMCDEADRPRFATKLSAFKWPDETPLYVAVQATAALGGCRR